MGCEPSVDLILCIETDHRENLYTEFLNHFNVSEDDPEIFIEEINKFVYLYEGPTSEVYYIEENQIVIPVNVVSGFSAWEKYDRIVEIQSKLSHWVERISKEIKKRFTYEFFIVSLYE